MDSRGKFLLKNATGVIQSLRNSQNILTHRIWYYRKKKSQQLCASHKKACHYVPIQDKHLSNTTKLDKQC